MPGYLLLQSFHTNYLLTYSIYNLMSLQPVLLPLSFLYQNLCQTLLTSFHYPTCHYHAFDFEAGIFQIDSSYCSDCDELPADGRVYGYESGHFG